MADVEHNLFQTDEERDQALAKAQRRQRKLTRRVYVREGERRETDPCEAGTIGCAVNHTASGFDAACDTY